jgi:tetratricopeptide (TPR) repeat protein
LLEYCQQTLKENDTFAPAYLWQGVAYAFGLKAYQKALTCYNQAIELSADYALAYAFRGYIAKECELSENEDYEKAILFSTKVIEGGKATFNDYYARAWAYSAQGKYDLALLTSALFAKHKP